MAVRKVRAHSEFPVVSDSTDQEYPSRHITPLPVLRTTPTETRPLESQYRSFRRTVLTDSSLLMAGVVLYIGISFSPLSQFKLYMLGIYATIAVAWQVSCSSAKLK